MELRIYSCKNYYNFLKEKCIYSLRRSIAAGVTSSERLISSNFCLFFNMLIQMMIDIINQASTYDCHLFEDYQKHHNTFNKLRESCYNIRHSPLDALSQISG